MCVSGWVETERAVQKTRGDVLRKKRRYETEREREFSLNTWDLKSFSSGLFCLKYAGQIHSYVFTILHLHPKNTVLQFFHLPISLSYLKTSLVAGTFVDSGHWLATDDLLDYQLVRPGWVKTPGETTWSYQLRVAKMSFGNIGPNWVTRLTSRMEQVGTWQAILVKKLSIWWSGIFWERCFFLPVQLSTDLDYITKLLFYIP